MALPEPVSGLVIPYSYLRKDEYQRGHDEGVKDRPCAVILVSANDEHQRVVTVLPITHTPRSDPTLAVEIPAGVKRRLRLDDERSWVVLSEANRFIWPGPDLSPARPGDLASVSYGPLPFALFEEIRIKFIAAIKARRASVVSRSE